MVRDAKASFGQAADFFLSVVEAVRPDQWERPGLGVWTVRDLAGHASRALLTIETYLQRPAERVEAASGAEYFRRALAGWGDPEAVARRGREAGAALGDDPPAAVRALVGRILALVAATDDDRLLTTAGGGMRFGDYLETRTFELIVHGLDLAAAIGHAARPPAAAAADCLAIVAERLVQLDQAGPALLALTGRRPLPPGFTVL